MERKKLTNLDPRSYEHPRDQRALDALEGTPGLEKLVRRYNEWGIERILRVQYTGSNLRVNPDNFPELYDALEGARDTLDLPALPELYITGEEGIQGATAGVSHPIVLISSRAVDSLSTDELSFVVAHELGHIKSGHVLYHQVAEYLPAIASVLESATLGMSGLFTTGLQVALLNWQRTSELTADRAGLLGCQNPNAALSALMKIAGLPEKYHKSINTEDFIAQARAFETLESDPVSRLVRALSAMERTHPWTVMRAKELLCWIDGGDYGRLLSAPHRAAATAASAPLPSVSRFCVRCGHSLGGGEFCTACGAKIAPTPS